MPHKVVIYIAQKDIPTLLEELPEDALERLAQKAVEVAKIEDPEERGFTAVWHIIAFFAAQHRVWFIKNNIKLPKAEYDTIVHPTTQVISGWNIIYEFDRAEDAARFDLNFG